MNLFASSSLISSRVEQVLLEDFDTELTQLKRESPIVRSHIRPPVGTRLNFPASSSSSSSSSTFTMCAPGNASPLLWVFFRRFSVFPGKYWKCPVPVWGLFLYCTINFCTSVWLPKKQSLGKIWLIMLSGWLSAPWVEFHGVHVCGMGKKINTWRCWFFLVVVLKESRQKLGEIRLQGVY